MTGRDQFRPDVAIAEIEIGERVRPISEATVRALLEVIGEYGFTVPILIQKRKTGLRLIDGAHRLESMRRRGELVIPACVRACPDAEARELETTQNLAGASLSPLDDALFLAAYARAYEERHPETKRGVAGALGRHGSANELSSFADLVAEKRAITARQVQKMVKAGRALSRDDATRLRAAPQKVTLSDLLTLARVPTEKRDGAIALFAIGGKIADALRTPSAAPEDPVEEEFNALRASWERASEAARRRFVAEFHAALSARVRDEAERRIVNGRLGEAPESAAADIIRGTFGPRATRGRTA